MKVKKRLGVMLFLMVLLAGCSNKEVESKPLLSISGSPISRSESTFKKDSVSGMTLTTQQSSQIGTQISVGIYDKERVPNEVFDEVFTQIDAYEHMISKNISQTEVSLINKNAGIKPTAVSEKLFKLIQKSISYAQQSEGIFDISVGIAVNLWDIGGDNAHVPKDEEIESVVNLIDYKNIILDEENHTVFLKEPGMIIDLGGIAKGFISDEIGNLIRAKGYTSAIINFGGNVYGVGTKPQERDWVVGVRNPLNEGLAGVLTMKNKAVISSGVYERFFMDGETRYHHIINPMTGYPEQNELLSVTIVSDKGIDGDALSTTLFLMGLEKGLAYAEESDEIEALFITNAMEIFTTSGLKDAFQIEDNTYNWIQ